MLRIVPAGVSDDVASIMEPLGIAVRAAAESAAVAMDLLFTGCGPIGLMIVMVARVFGAGRIFVSDPSAARRTLAVSLGADMATDPGTQSAVDTVCSPRFSQPLRRQVSTKSNTLPMPRAHALPTKSGI